MGMPVASVSGAVRASGLGSDCTFQVASSHRDVRRASLGGGGVTFLIAFGIFTILLLLGDAVWIVVGSMVNSYVVT